MNLVDAPINWWATSLFAVLCFMLGLLTGRFVALDRAQVGPSAVVEPDVELDAGTERSIDDAAVAWAEREGRPASHAGVASSYVKLAARLQQRRYGRDAYWSYR
jgi:hypothetical protein